MKYLLVLSSVYLISIAIDPSLRQKVSHRLLRVWTSLIAFCQKLVLALARYFFRLHRWLAKQEQHHRDPTTDTPPLGTLTAINDASNIGLYETELIKKLADLDVKNIAITGPYGSGKSSLIKTFFARHLEYQPLYVSLAAFKDSRKVKANNKDENGGLLFDEADASVTPEQQKLLDDRIEYSILQQLFYHVRGKDVPFSRLKRIRTIKPAKIALLALGVIAYVCCVLYLYFPHLLPGYALWSPKLPAGSFLNYTAMAGMVGGAVCLMYLLFKFQQHASLIKLNIDKAGLEISPGKGSSVLNQHMDEIVYYFGATRHDLLVIEDLDRFRNPEIFVKLREINTLINNSLQVGRKITFIYALRDDVFADESRTKFFDFILPVVPVTNASNSASSLINMFDALHLPQNVSHNLLNDLSLFITDRRLILNIFNEFRVYHNQLDNRSLNVDMLLGMIVYKNLHPTDFSNLQSNQGMVYEFLQSKHAVTAAMIKGMEEELLVLESGIKKVEELHLKRTEELRLVYLGALYNYAYLMQGDSFSGKVNAGDKWYNLSQLVDESAFTILSNERSIRIWNNNGTQSTISFPKLEKEVDNNQTYAQRKEFLELVNDNHLNNLKSRRQEINDSIKRTRGQSMQELLIVKKMSSFTTAINDHPALAYLVGNGFISEDYWLYVSYFQPGQLSEQDFQFILAVKSRTDLKFEHPLLRVNQVMLRLNDSDYLLPEVLNYQLLYWLLTEVPHHSDKILGILNQLARPPYSWQWQFLIGFRHRYADTMDRLVPKMIDQWPGFWSFLNFKADGDLNTLRFYRDIIIRHGNIESIIALDGSKEFSRFIAASADLFKIIGDLSFIEPLIIILQRLQIRFYDPAEGRVDGSSPLFEFVFHNHHYEINKDMVPWVLTTRFRDKKPELITQGQLAGIFNGEWGSFSAYALENLDQYVNNVFLQFTSWHEKEETIILLLNSKQLSDETKVLVIETVPFEITDLETVRSVFYDALLDNYRCKPNWHNLWVLKNYEVPPLITGDVIAFVVEEPVYTILASDNIDIYEEEETKMAYREILVELLQNPQLSASCKEALLVATKEPLVFTSFEGVGYSLVQQLIKEDKIVPNAKALSALIRIDYRGFVSLVMKHWATTSTLLGELDLSLKNYETLLHDPVFGREYRLPLYQSMDRETLMGFLVRKFWVPKEALAMERFALSTQELENIAGMLDREVVVALLEIYENLLPESLVIDLLKMEGGDFMRIASRVGKEVSKTDEMVALLPLLKRMNMLIEDFDEKKSVINVFYRQ